MKKNLVFEIILKKLFVTGSMLKTKVDTLRKAQRIYVVGVSKMLDDDDNDHDTFTISI